MLVPRMSPCCPSLSVKDGPTPVWIDPARDEPMYSPGAAMSGLVRPSRVGPREEKPERLPTPESVLSTAGVVPPVTLIQWSLSAYEPAVMAYFAVPGMPTLFPRFEALRLTNLRNPASASSHTSNVGEEEPVLFVVIWTVQVPVRGATTGLHEELSQIWMNASLSPFRGSGPLVASTWIAPSVVQTIPESTPRAAPTTVPVGVTMLTVELSAPLYQTSSQ